MAFGIGRAFKKGWKKTFGKLEDEIKPYTPIIAGAALGALTGGLGWVASGAGGILGMSAGASGAILGGVAGTAQGLSTYQQNRQQENMIDAQLAAADKIAAAQNAPVLQSAATPTASIQEAQTAEMNEATAKRKAFSFANTRRSGSVARRNTLG